MAASPPKGEGRLRWYGRAVGLLVVAGLAAGYGLGSAGLLPVLELDVSWSFRSEEPGRYIPSTGALRPGRELALVYVGSSSCPWSSVPGLPEAVERSKLQLQAEASANGWGFTAVGIARDGIVTNGLAHLEKFGDFDEVMSGRSWANIGMGKYVYGAMPGPAETPQLIVLEHVLQMDSGTIAYVGENVLRASGSAEIEVWGEKGVPVKSEWFQ